MRIVRLVSVFLSLAPVAAMAVEPAVITFNAPTAYTDGSPIEPGTAISYNVLQGEKGQPKVKVATITESGASISSGLVAGQEYCFAVTAVINGVEGPVSNEDCKSYKTAVVVITVR